MRSVNAGTTGDGDPVAMEGAQIGKQETEFRTYSKYQLRQPHSTRQRILRHDLSV
jgi:hypothetical protein